MKHIFILNPAAGQGEATRITGEIEQTAHERGLSFVHDEKGDHKGLGENDILIYETKGYLDAERYVREITSTADKDWKLRFYACGGDGTMHEVVNGCVGRDDVEIAQFPFGTGNDFVRSFHDAGSFLDIKAQMDGRIIRCDAIKYTGRINGKDIKRYCMNMFNIGLDCNVVDLTARLKKIPYVKGSFSYYLGAVILMIEKKGADLRIEYDDGTLYDGKLLLVAIGNGRFCGGGVQAVPKAEVDDGRFDVSLVENIKRRDFAFLFRLYKEGTHLMDERSRKFFKYKKCKKLKITPNKGTMKLCTDGEVTEAGPVEFEIVPYAINFVIPKK